MKNILFLISSFTCITFCGCSNSKIKTEYAVFRGDNFHSARYISSPVTRTPKIKWTFSSNGQILSTAVCWKDKIYFGSADSSCYCLDGNNGKIIWKYKTDGPVNSSPVISNENVYFLSGDGRLYCFDANKGILGWNFQTDGEKRFSAPGIHGAQPKDSVIADAWVFFYSSPLVYENKIYFGTGSGYFYSIDQRTGKLAWKFKTANVIHCSPAIASGNVYFGSWDTYFYALNAESGKIVWKFKTGEDKDIYNQTGIQGSPLIDSDHLYFGCRDAHMYAINSHNGQKKWDLFTDYAWVSTSPLLYQNALIFCTGDTRKVMEVNKNSGVVIHVDSSKGWNFSSPVITDSIFYFGDINGFLYGYSAITGKRLWCFQNQSSKEAKYQILNADSTFNTSILFSAAKRKKENKTSMEMIYSLGSWIASPVINKGIIYIGSTDHNFYALQ